MSTLQKVQSASLTSHQVVITWLVFRVVMGIKGTSLLQDWSWSVKLKDRKFKIVLWPWKIYGLDYINWNLISNTAKPSRLENYRYTRKITHHWSILINFFAYRCPRMRDPRKSELTTFRRIESRITGSTTPHITQRNSCEGRGHSTPFWNIQKKNRVRKDSKNCSIVSTDYDVI